MAILFKNERHRQFYEEQVRKTNMERDPYHKAFFYTMGLLDDTRRNIDKLYNFKERCVDPAGLRGGWHTGESVKVCRLACNLFNGYTVCGKAASMFTPEELFCSGLINYMLEAVRIRYADYSRIEE